MLRGEQIMNIPLYLLNYYKFNITVVKSLVNIQLYFLLIFIIIYKRTVNF
jgi:hypothetical protein